MTGFTEDQELAEFKSTATPEELAELDKPTEATNTWQDQLEEVEERQTETNKMILLLLKKVQRRLSVLEEGLELLRVQSHHDRQDKKTAETMDVSKPDVSERRRKHETRYKLF